jgi:flagellar export protein FliJ
MTGFRFRLKPVLSLREAERDLRRAQLAESLAAERTFGERKAALENELGEQRRLSGRDARPGRIDLDRLTMTDRYLRELRCKLQAICRSEQALAARIDEQQQAVAAAEGEVRVLENLRERQLADFRRGQALAEIKVLDEAAARGAVHEPSA